MGTFFADLDVAGQSHAVRVIDSQGQHARTHGGGVTTRPVAGRNECAVKNSRTWIGTG